MYLQGDEKNYKSYLDRLKSVLKNISVNNKILEKKVLLIYREHKCLCLMKNNSKNNENKHWNA